MRVAEAAAVDGKPHTVAGISGVRGCNPLLKPSHLLAWPSFLREYTFVTCQQCAMSDRWAERAFVWGENRQEFFLAEMLQPLGGAVCPRGITVAGTERNLPGDQC